MEEATWQHLQSELLDEELELLEALPGHRITVKFSYLLMDAPFDLGKESRTTAAMQQLIPVLHLMGMYSGMQVLPNVWGNRSERGAGSVSSVVAPRLRPDCVVVSQSCTVMIGEDKEEGKLQQAISDIKFYARAGLPAVQYGTVPGIPAYAAAGTELQFLYIKRNGTVRWRRQSSPHQHTHDCQSSTLPLACAGASSWPCARPSLAFWPPSCAALCHSAL